MTAFGFSVQSWTTRPDNVVNDGNSDSHEVVKDERYRTMWTTRDRDDRNPWRLMDNTTTAGIDNRMKRLNRWPTDDGRRYEGRWMADEGTKDDGWHADDRNVWKLTLTRDTERKTQD